MLLAWVLRSAAGKRIRVLCEEVEWALSLSDIEIALANYRDHINAHGSWAERRLGARLSGSKLMAIAIAVDRALERRLYRPD